tara:strand:- start:428 stop:1051 length:624 start_codon:yes stop_codon:yes gene_type:complete
MANEIDKVATPALPLATEEYSRPYMDQNSNVLRLFFNRFVNSLNTLLSTDVGGKFLYMPNGLFYSTVDQSAAVVNTGYPVEFENTYISSSVSIGGTGDTQITASADGVYSFQVTLQTEHNNASAVSLWTWINKNGTDQPYGGQKNTIKGNDDTAVHWNFSIDLTAGQYIEMYWATDDTDLNLHTEAATSPHPGIPSAVVAVSFVSNL